MPDKKLLPTTANLKGISNIGGGIDGDLISQTLGGQETGSSAGLSYPLDVVGNPAYPATVRFKVMRYGSPTETSQKEEKLRSFLELSVLLRVLCCTN